MPLCLSLNEADKAAVAAAEAEAEAASMRIPCFAELRKWQTRQVAKLAIWERFLEYVERFNFQADEWPWA